MPTIETVPAFKDNYIWLLCADDAPVAWVVDPGDAQPVLNALRDKRLQLGGILITHHHPDHVGGVAALRAQFDVPVYGPAKTPAQCITHPLREGDRVAAAGYEFSVLEVPGHTLDHIAYFCAAPSPFLFCGDTLFAGGCGRVFEGTFPMMHQSLQKIAHLPANTMIYCAHEYTLSNLRFALAVEPENTSLQNRRDHDQQRRDRQLATVPSSLDTELATNPFLRCGEATVRRAVEKVAGKFPDSDVDTFAALRGWKDNF